jgi:CheY-like chemotaxis protein
MAARILLVEDNEMNRDMLSRRLARRGYQVATAVDGEAGIALARTEPPALVLMDMSLPGIDGWEATRRLKGDPATRAIPVIALTAHAMGGDRELALAAGCDDFDTKPIDLDRLLGKIEALLHDQVPVEATAPGRRGIAAPAPAEPTGAAETAAATPPPATGERRHASLVLVVDDDPAVRDLMGRYLAREGFRVATAAGGEEGLRLARDLQPAAITLDVLMPGMDGWSVLGALKTDAATADIPVVMLTIVDDRHLGYALGAAEYLTKPIDRERLLAVLARHRRRDRPLLVVEDDAPLRQRLRRVLEREGYAVVEAAHGRAALERLREGLPGAILLDLGMPVMDGFAFLVEMRREPAWQHVPVIVLTAAELSAEEREKLNGSVARVLDTSGLDQERLLAEVCGLVATSLGPAERA